MPFVIISGCSGGGKSTILAELASRGHKVVEEPGRRIVHEELALGGSALPWVDPDAFIRRAIETGVADYRAASSEGWTFFDRGLLDAWSALSEMEGKPLPSTLAADWPFHRTVFLTPPWPEIYVNDAERRHDMVEAEREYLRLCRDYPALGHAIVEVPRLAVSARADFILQCLEKPAE